MNQSLHILVVDDEEEIRDLTRMIFDSAGYRVSLASSGDEALRILRSRRPDLVLLDINMPERDGWETLRLIRADEAISGVRVVMFSVKSEVRDRIHGMQEGAVDYICKPFAVDELLARVRRVLEEGRAPAASLPEGG